ncbi:MAG: choice-of-anchor J domain-containing protein [Prevotella sp.]|nr:choice-of-anchor J domain-containing protein [Prevotella sp.]
MRDLTVTADADGAAKATLSFMTPTTTVKGDALTSLQYLVIKRVGAPIDTLRNVSPGEKISYTDDQAVKNKVNTYEVVACNEEGEGMPVSQSTYVGIDVPLPPTLLVASYGDNGKINLSWKAPATGVTGGYIDPDNLYYGIQRSVGGKAVVLTNNQKQTTYTDQIDDSGEQAYLLYGVSAANRSGYSDLATSNALIKGTPYTLPFMETLKDGSTDHFWGMQSSVTDSHAAWGAQDGAFMFSSSYQPGDDALLYSGKISLANAKNPILEYDYWYRAEEGDDSLLVYVIKNGHDTTLVSRQNYVRYMYDKDYEKITVPLKQFATADTKFIQVAFYLKTYSSDATQMASVRNVTVRDQRDHDLMASSISAPAQVQVGDTVHVVARVKNYGSQTSGKYSVKLYDHDKVVGTSEADALPSDSVAQFIFKIPVTTLQDSLYFHFTVDDAADEVAANNTSSDAGVAVTLPVYPKPEKLTASQESAGKVTLSWTAPAYEDFVIPTTDGAEAYDAFAIDNIGEWTVVDRDHKATRSDITVDSYDVNFTHKGDAMAWIVMNPSKAGASFTNWMGDPTGWQPVSGDQYFASFSAADSTNDDWLISPELPGDAQTISFSEHGYYGMEHYEVLYSTTDTNPSSFVSLGEKTSDASWTQVSFDLPAGAKYFAIRNLGAEYSQYLFVDDINFKPLSGKGVLQLCGYRIYADGELVDSVAANVLQYVVADAATLYQVTAVYNRGESAAASCQGVSTGINRVEIPGGIHLCGSVLSSNDPVRVFTASGTLVFEGIANHIRLTHGFYIIQVGNKSYKVTVR